MAGGDFNIRELYEALDERRRALDLSWQVVAREVSSRFVGASGSRAVSASTITGLRDRRVAEADGVLQMLLWLGRTPESFCAAREERGTQLADVGRNRILRVDTRAVYLALETRRAERGMTWKQVAEEIGGVAPASLTRLSAGGRTSFPDIARIAHWLGRPIASLTHSAAS